jgi:hypothetical protein
MKTNHLQVYSGKPVWPLEITTDMIDIGDIAHSLSMQCRFNGHCERFYSVAEHSVLCSRYVEPGYEVAALLHDAAESYIGDIVKPVKVELEDFLIVEDRIEKVISDRFGLEFPFPEAVHRVDKQMVLREMLDNLKPGVIGGKPMGITEAPADIDLRYWSPDQAERAFLERCEELGVS